jgi:hypothetical protein
MSCNLLSEMRGEKRTLYRIYRPVQILMVSTFEWHNSTSVTETIYRPWHCNVTTFQQTIVFINNLWTDLKQNFTQLLMMQVEVFWVVTPYSVVVGYQRFRGPCCLHLQGEVKWWRPCSDMWNLSLMSTFCKIIFHEFLSLCNYYIILH